MKKTLLFLLLLSASITAFPQTHYIGGKAGVSFSKIASKFAFKDDTHFKPGFTGGIDYEYAFGNDLIVGAGILYSEQGFRQGFKAWDEADNVIASGYTTFYYNYIQVPLTFGLEWTSGKKIVVTSKLGLQPGFLLNSKVHIPAYELQEEETLTMDEVAKFDLELVAVFGIGYRMNPQMIISLEGSGNMGLTTFSSKNYFESSNLRHRLAIISLAVKYALK